MYKLIKLNKVRRTFDGASFDVRDTTSVDAQEFASWLWSGERPEQELFDDPADLEKWAVSIIQFFGMGD